MSNTDVMSVVGLPSSVTSATDAEPKKENVNLTKKGKMMKTKNPFKKERRLLMTVLDFACDCVSISRHWDDMPADSLEKIVANRLDKTMIDANMCKLLEAGLWITENTQKKHEILRLRFDLLEKGLDLSTVEMDESEREDFFQEMTEALEEGADAFTIDENKKTQWAVNPYREIGSRILNKLPPLELKEGFAMLAKDIRQADLDGETFTFDFGDEATKNMIALAKLVELMSETAKKKSA
jgi:hypothetical protein